MSLGITNPSTGVFYGIEDSATVKLTNIGIIRTVENDATIIIGIPVANPDATTHNINFEIDESNNVFTIEGKGDGAGSVDITENKAMLLKTGTATLGSPVFNSSLLNFQASGWDSDGAVAVTKTISLCAVPASGTTVLASLQFKDDGTIFGYLSKFGVGGINSMMLASKDTDGAGAIGLVVGADSNFVTAGAKLLSVRNNIGTAGGTEVFYVDKDGGLGASGSFVVADITISDTTPVLNFKDTSCTDADVNASIQADATDTGTGAEDIDVTFKQQVAGVITTFLVSDADGSLALGQTGQAVTFSAGLSGITTLSMSGALSGLTTFSLSQGITQTTTVTGTLYDMVLETEWTTGTLINADFGGATVQSGDMTGVLLDFNTNLAGVTDLDVTGYLLKLPALTQVTANTTNYIGWNLSTAGALVQNTLVGTINWKGINIQMPNITQTTGAVNSYGLYITGGTVTSGTEYAIYVSSADCYFEGTVTGITSLGVTGTRITTGFFTDLTVTNTITGSITGNAVTVTVADTTDASCYVGLFEDASGSLGAKTDTGLTYSANTGILTATGFSGPLTGDITGNCSGSSGTCTGNAGSATVLQTARTIGGVNFDGSGNITVASATGGFSVSGGNLTLDADIAFSDAAGTTTIASASVAGVARAITFNIPIDTGGAGDAAIDYQLQLDGVLEAGLLAETDGAGTYRNPVWKVPYMTGDYGAAWVTFTAPAPTSLANGSMVVAYNSNAGVLASRLYIYSNNAWASVALT